jgi:hypothetical protein
VLTWPESADWTTATCSEGADTKNYREENQTSFNLMGPDLILRNVKNAFSNSSSSTTVLLYDKVDFSFSFLSEKSEFISWNNV